MSPWGWLVELARDDRGQDLIEYALLSAFIGVTLLLVMQTVTDALAGAYGTWLAGVNALWETPPPG